ncbi:DNA/RNA non-specific endonuclease [Hymenobacter terrenus]|uniref:DNA/RNA non-specific endonuclease n=1 Tax=Hymenobacter terrenus TaxID=1629124 RepID=UPI0006961110|nr:DNA/RNA non-specific endonuclease [Hymenobacter terrenus]
MPHTDYVVSLALAKCSKGTLPVPLPVTSQPLHLVGGLAVATELDIAPLVNIPCFGICQQLTKLASGVPTPCVPVPTGWKGANPARKIMGLKPLLEKATCACALGGTVSFQSSGQLGPAKFQTGPNFLMFTAGSVGGWNKALNKTPLEPNHDYLVDNYLYSTDADGRVVKVRGDLEDAERDRYPSQQSASVPKKDGQANAQHQAKPAAPQPDTRPMLARRRYTDDGGHLLAAMFNGPGEQINYVPMDMDLNQAGPNTWYAMEQEWKNTLRGGNPPPPRPQKVDVEINIVYAASKRPVGFEANFWIGNGARQRRRFRNAKP